MAGFQIGQYVSGGAAANPFVSQSVASAPDHRCRQVVAVVAANLLLTTLAAVVTAPIVPQAQASAPQYRWQLSQTSAGTPKALYADAQLPVQNAPAPVLDRLRWLPADATRGIPKALTADAVVPVVNTPHTAPDRVRPVVDTSQSQPITLQDVPVPAPLVNPPHLAPLRYPSLPADTSRGTAKPLYGDALAPFLNVPHTAPDRVRPVVDTSQKQPITLQAIVVPLPPFTLPHQAPARYPHGLADTSGCTPKTLYDDAVVPPVVVTPDVLSGGWPVPRVRDVPDKRARRLIREAIEREEARQEAIRQQAQAEVAAERRELAAADSALDTLELLFREREVEWSDAYVEVLRSLLAQREAYRLAAIREAQRQAAEAEAAAIAELARQEQLRIERNNENARRVLLMLGMMQ